MIGAQDISPQPLGFLHQIYRLFLSALRFPGIRQIGHARQRVWVFPARAPFSSSPLLAPSASLPPPTVLDSGMLTPDWPCWSASKGVPARAPSCSSPLLARPASLPLPTVPGYSIMKPKGKYYQMY